MKNTIFLPILMLVAALSAASQNIVTVDDVKPLEGAKWIGKLTYLDYSSNKRTSIQSSVTISPSSKNGTSWIFKFEYPLEPKANATKEIKLSLNGREIDGESVSERTELADGIVRIITTSRGIDNGKEATFRKTYLIGKESFSIKKEVQIAGDPKFFERNTYLWTR